MKPTACILLAEGFEEIEAVTIFDVLRRGNVDAALVGVSGMDVTGAHGLSVHCDISMEQALDRTWDVVVLPGGLPGAHNLRDHAGVKQLITHQHEAKRRVAAICAAPIVLANAGLLEGKQVTCYPGFEEELHGASVKKDDIVVDGTVTTSRGPGTAMAFALELITQLHGAKQSNEVAAGLLYQAHGGA